MIGNTDFTNTNQKKACVTLLISNKKTLRQKELFGIKRITSIKEKILQEATLLKSKIPSKKLFSHNFHCNIQKSISIGKK